MVKMQLTTRKRPTAPIMLGNEFRVSKLLEFISKIIKGSNKL